MALTANPFDKSSMTKYVADQKAKQEAAQAKADAYKNAASPTDMNMQYTSGRGYGFAADAGLEGSRQADMFSRGVGGLGEAWRRALNMPALRSMMQSDIDAAKGRLNRMGRTGTALGSDAMKGLRENWAGIFSRAGQDQARLLGALSGQAYGMKSQALNDIMRIAMQRYGIKVQEDAQNKAAQNAAQQQTADGIGSLVGGGLGFLLGGPPGAYYGSQLGQQEPTEEDLYAFYGPY